jgi:hypothetical protein
MDVTSRRCMATAVPIDTFRIQYAGEGLTISKYAHRAARLNPPVLSAKDKYHVRGGEKSFGNTFTNLAGVLTMLSSYLARFRWLRV